MTTIYGPPDLTIGSGSQNNPRWRVFDTLLISGALTKIHVYITEADSNPMFGLFVRDGDNNEPIFGLPVNGLSLGPHSFDVDWPIPDGGAYFGIWGDGVGLIKDAWDGQFWQDTTSIQLSAFNVVSTSKGQAVNIEVDETAIPEHILNPPCPPSIQSPDYAKIYFGVAGQSNAEGSADAGRITTRQEFGALSFEKPSNQVIAATSDGSHEYVGFGASAYLNQRASGPKVFAGRNGSGGMSIDQLSKGTAPFSDGISQWDLAVIEGADHIGQFWIQGEADARDETGRVGYKEKLIQLADDYAVDVDQTVKTYAAQLSANRTSWADGAAWDVALGMLDAERESSRVRVACPTYNLTFPRGEEVHYDGHSVRVLGAYLMRAALTGQRALQCIDVHRDGSFLVLTYNKSDLSFDDGPFRQPSYGYRAFGTGGNEVDIDSVEIISCNQVALETLGDSCSYGNMRFRGREKWAGLGGNLRDNAGWGDVFDGVPLHNWALLQDMQA